MPIKYYFSRFWLATSVSFYLFTPYLSRYIGERNRFNFHWTRWDLFSLLFCIALLGTIFFLCFILLYVKGKKFSSRVFEIAFIATVGVALVANIYHLVRYSENQSSAYIFKLGIVLWILWFSSVLWIVFRSNKKIKTVLIAFCFIASPIIPMFTFNALGYKSFVSDRGSIPTLPETENHAADDKRNVYIFIFDEWSYQRSFKTRKLIKEFKDLEQFAAQALVFHNSTSPWPNTFTSIPSFLFQTNLRFFVEGNLLGFQGEQNYTLNQARNIFQHAQELGFDTSMIGAAIPYGELLGDSVDFCRSICVYKRFGDSFFNVAKYHLLTAGLLLPAPLLCAERNLMAGYCFNRFQINRINATHELFKTVVQNQTRPTFAVFHYMLPHLPYVFNRDGPKKLFAIYKSKETSNYYGNLSYLDRKIGEIISVLKQTNKFDDSLIVMT